MQLKRILSMIAVGLSCQIIAYAQTDFRHINLNEALAAAKKEKKLVFVDFYTDWCGPCKRMAADVFPQKNLGDYMNKRFVSIKLNAEKEGKEDAKHYGVSAYPTFYVLDAEGEKKLQITGFMDAESFMAKIETGLDPKMSIEAMGERYAKGERTPALVNAWALHHMEKRDETTGFAIVKEYFESLKEKDLLKEENAFLFTRYTVSLTEPMGVFMTDHRNDFAEAVRPAIQKKVQTLAHRDLNTYFSGYRWAENKFVESEYQALKAKIYALGLDKGYAYAPMFRLIEARIATQDDGKFFAVCKAEYDNLEPNDKTLLILNLTRLITTDNQDVLKDISSFIRQRLATMDTSTISLCASLLKSVEDKIKK